MKYSVDRTEGNLAVLEDENCEIITVERSLLPADIKDGSMLIFDGKNYVHDYNEERIRRKRIFEKQQKLLSKKNNNDKKETD